MVKKRTIRKRLLRRQQPLKRDVSKMTRLEYEQNLMDPRFRAAMMGFNNPVNSGQMAQVNHALHEKENKNNELTQLLTKQQELTKAKEQEIQLKDELTKTKLNDANRIKELELKAKTEQLQHEKEIQAREHEHEKQITELKNDIAQTKRDYEEEQRRFKQEQELKQTQHDKEMMERKAEHEKDMNAIRKDISKLAKKEEMETFQENAAQQIADITFKKMKAEMNEELQNTLTPLKEATEQANRSTEMAKTVYEAEKKVKDAIKETMISQFKATIEPKLEALNYKRDELQRQLGIFNEQLKAIKDFKDAKFKLDKTQIQAISEPIIQRMELERQDKEKMLKLNQDIFEQIKKQGNLEIDNALLNQRLDPQLRNEHLEHLKHEKLQTHQLEMINAQAEQAHKAFEEKEAVRSKIITNAAKIFPDFKVEDIDKPEFTKKMLDKEAEIRKQQAEYSKQLELSERLLNQQRQMAEEALKHEESKARLDATNSKASQEYISKIQEVSKKRLDMKRETQRYMDLEKELSGVIDERNAAIENFDKGMMDYLDSHQSVKQEAMKIANKKRGDKKGFITPDIFKQAMETVGEKSKEGIELLQNIPTSTEHNEEIEQVINTIQGGMGYDLNQQRAELTRDIAELQKNKDEQYQTLQEKQSRLEQMSRLMVGVNNVLTDANGFNVYDVASSIGMHPEEIESIQQEVNAWTQ